MPPSKIDKKLDTIIEHVGEIKTKLAVLDERDINTAKDIEAIQLSLVAQNGRLGKLENWKSKITGIAAAGIPIISMAASWLQHKLEGS